MKAILFSLVCFVTAVAQADYTKSCAWDGAEELKSAIYDSNMHWLEAALGFYDSGDDAPANFEGVGSCRFVQRTLGATPAEVVSAFMEKQLFIIPTRGYLAISGGAAKIVIPSALYAKATNYLFIKKETYNHVDAQVCSKQVEQTKAIGKNSVDLGLTDVSYKSTPTGSVVALINGTDTEGNYLGLCYFAPVQN